VDAEQVGQLGSPGLTSGGQQLQQRDGAIHRLNGRIAQLGGHDGTMAR
jgi:hypothetical protein